MCAQNKNNLWAIEVNSFARKWKVNVVKCVIQNYFFACESWKITFWPAKKILCNTNNNRSKSLQIKTVTGPSRLVNRSLQLSRHQIPFHSSSIGPLSVCKRVNHFFKWSILRLLMYMDTVGDQIVPSTNFWVMQVWIEQLYTNSFSHSQNNYSIYNLTVSSNTRKQYWSIRRTWYKSSNA